MRLLLVDDHQVVLEGLLSMLAAERHRVTVVGSTTEPEENTARRGTRKAAARVGA